MRTLIVGIGRAEHGDDGAGLMVARHLIGQAQPDVTILTSAVDPAHLRDLDEWHQAELVVIVAAERSPADPGTVRLLDAGREPLPPLRTPHHGDRPIVEVLEDARLDGDLPEAVLVYAITGEVFTRGAEPSDAVRDAARTVAGRIMTEVLDGDLTAVTG
jgi:hydrogenase maturation protease